MIARVAAALRAVPYLMVCDLMREEAKAANREPPTSSEIYDEWCRRQAIAALEEIERP